MDHYVTISVFLFMQTYPWGPVQLMKRASRRVLGDNPNRKSPITINMLIGIYHLLDLSRPFHAAVWALLLVAFFSLLGKSNLLPATYQQVMNKDSPHLRRCNIHFNAKGVTLSVYKTKTIQFKQRVLTIHLPRRRNSILCPTQALHNYLRMVPAPGNFPVFLIKDSCSFFQPLLSSHFARVIKTLVSMLNPRCATSYGHTFKKKFRKGYANFHKNSGKGYNICKKFQIGSVILMTQMTNQKKTELIDLFDLVWTKSPQLLENFLKMEAISSQNSPQNRTLETCIRHKNSEKGPTFSSKIPKRVDIETL